MQVNLEPRRFGLVRNLEKWGQNEYREQGDFAKGGVLDANR